MDHQDYPEAVFVPFTPTGLMIQTACLGLDQMIRTATNIDGALPVDRYPQTITNIDDFTYFRTADDVALDLTFQWIPESSGKIDKFFMNFCTIGNMTAHTDDGNFWDTVHITITRVGGQDVLFDRTYATGLDEFDAVAEVRTFIVSDPVWGADMKIRAGNPLNIRIRTANTKTPTNIMHFGLVPFFPQQIKVNTADIQYWAQSGIMFYVSRDQE